MQNDKKHIAIVCNPRAGNGKALQVANRIVVYLKEKNRKHSLFTAQWPKEWNDITEAWIVGGDGTLNYFINQYPDIKIPLSIFKGGTGNDFQQLLYGNKTVEDQIEKLWSGSCHLIDAGICNGKLFLNGVGIGFDGAIVKALVSKKKNAGKTTYLQSVLKNIFFYKSIRCIVKFGTDSISLNCLMINIANGKTEGGGFRVAPNASVEDGKLEINILKEINPLKRLFYLTEIQKGNHIGLPAVAYHQTQKIEIQSDEILPAHMDGEYFEASHFIIECLPGRFSFFW